MIQPSTVVLKQFWSTVKPKCIERCSIEDCILLTTTGAKFIKKSICTKGKVTSGSTQYTSGENKVIAGKFDVKNTLNPIRQYDGYKNHTKFSDVESVIFRALKQDGRRNM